MVPDDRSSMGGDAALEATATPVTAPPGRLEGRVQELEGALAEVRQELQALLGQDVRKVLITTIHKFGEAGGKLNERCGAT